MRTQPGGLSDCEALAFCRGLCSAPGMSDTPEIPEAKDPFERLIALTIAILAVILSFVDNTGDNAKTDAIVKTTEAANRWAYYQSKSLKENLAETSATLLAALAPADPTTAKTKREEMTAEIARYKGEKQAIMEEAKALEKQSAYSMSINDRADQASLLLQIAVVICSIAILVRWKAIFYLGLTCGIAGIAVSILAFRM